jgi:hypothetical protein
MKTSSRISLFAFTSIALASTVACSVSPADDAAAGADQAETVKGTVSGVMLPGEYRAPSSGLDSLLALYDRHVAFDGKEQGNPSFKMVEVGPSTVGGFGFGGLRARKVTTRRYYGEYAQANGTLTLTITRVALENANGGQETIFLDSASNTVPAADLRSIGIGALPFTLTYALTQNETKLCSLVERSTDAEKERIQEHEGTTPYYSLELQKGWPTPSQFSFAKRSPDDDVFHAEKLDLLRVTPVKDDGMNLNKYYAPSASCINGKNICTDVCVGGQQSGFDNEIAGLSKNDFPGSTTAENDETPFGVYCGAEGYKVKAGCHFEVHGRGCFAVNAKGDRQASCFE